MSKARDPLSKIVVVGAGQVGAIAAIALKRALPASDVTVLGVPIEDSAFADNASTALPFTNKLHDRLGISEPQMIAQAGASHRLIMRYFGWAEPGSHGAMSYGVPSDPASQSGFAQAWGGGSRSASSAPAMRPVAEALADANRFATPPQDRESPLSEVDYALRWNVPAYRQMLISIAQKLGVSYVEGSVGPIELDSFGNVASLSVNGGGSIAADLFVDCSGPNAALLSQMQGYTVSDWRDDLPGHRLHCASPGQPMLALEDRISLLAEGWLSEHAGRDGLQIALCCPERISEEAIVGALGGTPIGSINLGRSHCREPWIGNVVALGDAAARFEPLAGLPLDLAHRQLALLLEMLPGKAIEPLEREEFNRRAALMMQGARDAVSLHYCAPQARNQFNVEIPLQVERAVDQFTRRGRLPFQEEAPFQSFETMSLMAALGIVPGIAPQFSAMSDQETSALQRSSANKAAQAVQFAPPYQQWMGQMLAQQAR